MTDVPAIGGSWQDSDAHEQPRTVIPDLGPFITEQLANAKSARV